MDLSPTPVGNGTSPLVLRVLVVEDSEFDARILVAQLRTGGWAVAFKRVASGPTLLATLQAEPWDLILCDHTMPGFSAPEALQILKARASMSRSSSFPAGSRKGWPSMP